VIIVTERIARERRDETVLKQETKLARNRSLSLRAKRSIVLRSALTKLVMAGLDPAISIRDAVPILSEMPGTRPGMTSH
jgi:hypothetical protein